MLLRAGMLHCARAGSCTALPQDLLNRPNRQIHLVLGIEPVEAEADGSLPDRSKRLVHQRRAMAAGAGLNPVINEQDVAHLAGIEIAEIDGDDGRAQLCGKITVDTDAANPANPLLEALRKPELPLPVGIHPD